MSNLEQLRPCSGYCQMLGAAVALLSVKDSVVIFNSPRWCALTGERELSYINKAYEQRLFCTEARENDILYGIENSLRETIQEAVELNDSLKLLSVISSCSMSLIGDDIKGVCESAVVCSRIISLDAGGFTGTFESGYKLAMLAILKNITVSRIKSIPKKVNLLGICTSYPHWEGNLAELKRLLTSVGIEVGITLGADELAIEELNKIPEAELNIVLVPEISLEIAEYLFDKFEQKYLVAPIPFGFKGTMQWLDNICKELGIIANFKVLEKEVTVLQRDIADAAYDMRNLFVDFNLQQIISRMPKSMTESVFKALDDSEIDIFKCSRCYCSGEPINKTDEYISWNILSDIAPLGKDSYQLLFGTEKERVMLQNFRRTLYLNFSMPTGKVKSKDSCFAGIRGWNNLVQNLFGQIRTLEYINNSL